MRIVTRDLEMAESTAEKGSKPFRTISDRLRQLTWIGGADGTRTRGLSGLPP